jgi:hypothetical protein
MQKCHQILVTDAILSLRPRVEPPKLVEKQVFGWVVCRLIHTGRNTKLQNSNTD